MVQLVPVVLQTGVGLVVVALTDGTTTDPRTTEIVLAKSIAFGNCRLVICMKIKVKLQQNFCWSFTQPLALVTYKHLGQSSL
jgi:hypothetical protein